MRPESPAEKTAACSLSSRHGSVLSVASWSTFSSGLTAGKAKRATLKWTDDWVFVPNAPRPFPRPGLNRGLARNADNP